MINKNEITVTFLGAAGTVTGSKYLIQFNDKKLLVDCGLFQGLKELRLRNWENLPFEVSELNCVVLTHGHLDHVGYLPLLIKQGFKGKIYATEPTIEVAKIILKDSARIQEEDAERANLYKYSKHTPAKPLYTIEEAEAVFPFFQHRETNTWMELFPGASYRLRYNGHIIGSVFIEIKLGDKLLVFSGDIGRTEDPLMRQPEKPEHADFLFIESTYGNRVHESQPETALAKAVLEAISENGTLIIPSFAVERAQLLIYYLAKLRRERVLPKIPIYVDTPMGTEVLNVFQKNLDWLKIEWEEFLDMCSEVNVIKKEEETEQLANKKTPKIIIAGSGMAAGGRVLTYFEHFLDDPNSTILFAGHQGEGTRGRAMLEGAKEIKMRGKYWPVKSKVVMVGGLSAHADKNELIDWMTALKKAPEKIFIVHGEKASAEDLKTEIERTYNYSCVIPYLFEKITLSSASVTDQVNV
jgi:metallo-beta-lactamase family protein